MHQIFLSRRALYLLVWDVQKCQGKTGSALDEVVEADVMSWLYALHLRAPESTVILVANKCDESVDKVADTVQTVRTRVDELLSKWHENRVFNKREASSLPILNVLDETSKISCLDGLGLEELVGVVHAQGITDVSVPPSWNLALVVVSALRDQQSPLKAAREHLNLPSGTSDVEEIPSALYIAKDVLTRQWNEIVQTLTESSELQPPTGTAAVLNPDSALEGSLLISEFAGQIIRADGGEGIFLDVGLLSEVLNPILDHNLPGKPFKEARFMTSRNRLCNTGVLNASFALHLWGQAFSAHTSESSADLCRFQNALFDVLIKLGVAFPLGRVRSPDVYDGSTSTASQNVASTQPNTLGPSLSPGPAPLPVNDRSASGTPVDAKTWPHMQQRDMLVWRWLPECLSQAGEATFKTYREELQYQAQPVTLSWEFDPAGAPRGLIERVIARCHVIGEAEEALCWRSGAVFRSHRVVGRADPLYVVKLGYNTRERVLSVTMFGTLQGDRVWSALRFVSSVMVDVSRDWSGALWAGRVNCPDHTLHSLYLATPTEAGHGSPLIPSLDGGCACVRNEETVVGQAVARLGSHINSRTDDPFQDDKDVYIEEQKEGDHEDEGGEPGCAFCAYIFSMWEKHAWATFGFCGTSAFSLFLAAVVAELSAAKTGALIAGIVLMVTGACASAYLSFQRNRAEQLLLARVEQADATV